MYTLFSDYYRHYGGKIAASWFNETSERIAEDVNHAIDYYRHGAYYVKSDHLLARLIHVMRTPLSYDIEQYYETASARALHAANAIELTTSINTGRWFEGIFFHGCKELIIGYSGQDDPVELMKGWRDLEPVRILEHPVSNMAYLLPDGKQNNTETGLVVIGINLPELMVMYRGFMLEQRAAMMEGRSVQGTSHFIGRYILPNMLKSQTDLVIVNRLINYATGRPMGEALRKLPFHISDYTHWLDRGLKEILRRIATLRMEYRTILEQIPTVFRDNPLMMPDIAETRQVWWALFTTRLKEMQFLLDVAGPEGMHYNQALVNTLKIDLKRFKNENLLEKLLPPELYDDVFFLQRHIETKD